MGRGNPVLNKLKFILSGAIHTLYDIISVYLITIIGGTNMYGIYQIKNVITNQVYIGQSIDLEKRKKSHFRALNGGYHENSKLQNSYNKYGADAFEFSVLESADYISPDDLSNLEIKHIAENLALSDKGFNLTPGGTNPPVIVYTAEMREAISKRVTGKGNPFYGKHHSEETKARLRESSRKLIGNKNGFYGKTHRPTWKEERRAIYDKKIASGWTDPKIGSKKPKAAVEAMKEHMPHRKQIEVDNIVYNSMSECSRKTGIPLSTISKRLKLDSFPNYKVLNEGLQINNTNGKRVVVDGVTYSSIELCAKELNVSRTTVHNRVYSNKFPNYKLI